MKLEEGAIALVKKIEQAYFVDRDIDFVISCLDQEITWMGIGGNEQYQGYEKIVSMLKHEQSIKTFHYEIIHDDYHVTSLSPQMCEVFCIIDLEDVEKDSFTTQMQLRISIICVQVQDEILIKSIHMSIAGSPNRLNKSLFASFRNESRDTLLRLVEEKTKELADMNDDLMRLTANLPGGIFRCRFDENLTIQQMSDGFLSMFGYTREEIACDLQGSFVNMIDPRDYERILDEVHNQMKSSNTKTIEYRVVCKDGRILWVLDKGTLSYTPGDNVPSFHCILVDITEEKKAQEELRLALEKHQIITNQTNDIIFEWNIQNDHFTFSSNWEKKFGYKPMSANDSFRIMNDSHLHREDGKRLGKCLKEIASGVPYTMCDVRIFDKNNQYIWCQARMTTQFNEQGKPISAVGVLVDINNLKIQSEHLLIKSQQDSLTKLYNKEASQAYIENGLKDREKQHAIMIIDIDDFKLVNDSMGHLFGDAFLSEVGLNLRRLFHGQDIVGRIGGDEFVAFLHDIPSCKEAEDKAQQVIDSFLNLKAEEMLKTPASCSIGIAMYPECGKTFNDLYHCADLALYEAKREGKNQYFVADHEFMNTSHILAYTNHSAISEKIDSDEESNALILSHLIEYVFRILYQSMDINAAINSILKIVGENFEVSRAYIFENIEDDKYCCNTFEWCNDGVEPEKNLLSHVSYEEDLGGKYFDNFNENDIFYCRSIQDLPKEQYDILAPQGILSMLQCAIRDNGKIVGYVGFDECSKNRFWTKEQINTLNFIAELVGIFLIKDRTRSDFERMAASLQSILDNQNSWVYVVEPDTYKLLYLNRKTRELISTAKVGVPCHKMFFNNEKPCEFCPLLNISNERNDKSIEVYNSVLNVYSLVDASEITWEGKRAYLLTCHDISDYQKRIYSEKAE